MYNFMKLFTIYIIRESLNLGSILIKTNYRFWGKNAY